MISFVTPTYNRENLIKETLDSILILYKDFKNFEINVIDDASQDNTFASINKHYSDEIKSGILKVYSLKENIGVTGAKNYGAKVSTGEWIVFLDSDDLLVSDNYASMLSELQKNNDADVVFFSCIDFDGNRIGKDFDSSKLTLEDYLKSGTMGEKLPVIKREIILEFPYKCELRGFEGITYLEMLLNDKNLYLNNLICRQYREDNSDRLSSFKGRLKRSNQLSKGFYSEAALLRKHKRTVPLNTLLKIPTYALLSVVSKIFHSKL